MSKVVSAEKRIHLGKNVSCRLRSHGKVPAILYGPGIENVALSLNKRDVIALLKTESGERTIFKVAFDGEERNVMIKELQVNPVTDELLHVDLIQIAMDRPIRVAVPVVLKGEAVGVKNEGGLVDFITRELEVECLPHLIPEHIEVDISGLHVHQSVKVANLPPLEGVKVIKDQDTVIVTIGLPEAEVAAAAEEVVTAPAEPEVIRKERAAKEEQEEKE